MEGRFDYPTYGKISIGLLYRMGKNMIINLLKECCENCIHIDAKAENIVTSYRNMLESNVVKSTTATIWCAHMEVCKEYREAESKDES
jgi:hypothetical protein